MPNSWPRQMAVQLLLSHYADGKLIGALNSLFFPAGFSDFTLPPLLDFVPWVIFLKRKYFHVNILQWLPITLKVKSRVLMVVYTKICFLLLMTKYQTSTDLNIKKCDGLITQSCLTLVIPWTVAHWPTRLLCPWDFPGKNIGAGCHFLLQ